MSAHTMLEQLLRQGLGLLQGQGQGGQAQGHGQGRAPMPAPAAGAPGWPAGQPGAQPPGAPGRGTDWGSFGAGAATGAAATGALGLLLGHKQARRYAGKVAKYGGIAAIGLMAYQAYGRWQAQQAGASGANQAPGGAPAAGAGGGGAAAPDNSAPPLALPAPRTVDRLGPAEAEPHSRAMLLAMVAAAKADGHLDARERGLLDAELGRLAGDHALRLWVDTELQRPLDPAEVARAASTPEIAAEMYLASLLVADDQSFMERAYLDELARQLRLAPGLKAELEAQAAAA